MTIDNGKVALATRGLTKRFGDTLAVSEVDLEIRRGEVYGFIGLNGAGKTTVLRALVGLVAPTAGQVEVLGQPPSAEVLARVGSMIEAPAFFPQLSGRDNLELLARYWGIHSAKVEGCLEQVGLAARSKDRFKGYSLGMKQRLALAAALLGEPEVLILDEPANGLDPSGIASLRELIRAQRDQGRTVVLSSHMLGEIDQVCDRIGLMHAGRLQAVGAPGNMQMEQGGQAPIELACSDPERAMLLAEAVPGVAAVARSGDGLVVTPDHGASGTEVAGQLVHDLVMASIRVWSVVSREASLEDAFLKMTQSNRLG